MSERQREQLVSFNSPPASSVSELLAARARRTPDAVAIAAPGRSPASYAELAGNAEGIARRLREAGVGRTDRVAVVLPNGPDMVTAFLGVSLRAVCAPLNPAYRRSELDFYLTDLRARAMILREGDGEDEARAAAQARGIPILEASPAGGDGPAGKFALSGDRAPLPGETGHSGPEDVALILYTSGMTSRPKAVPLTHRAMCMSAHNIARALRLEPEDRCLNVMPLFHTHGLIIAVLSSLMAGGSVACGPGFSPEDFFGWLAELRPTWYTASPTIHHAVVESAPAHRELSRRARLRFIRSSAAFLPSVVKAALERELAAPVIEAYGMTECAQITSNPLAEGRRRAGTVGVEAGPRVAIQDDAGNRLPPGQSGEIVIQGPAVMAGYEGSSASGVEPGSGGWFRTGDLGVLSADGYLTLTGRRKDIVNRGGEKIAPAEVDEVLMDHPAVFQAVAFGVPHPSLGEDVVAAVVLRESGSATEKELRDFAATRLARHKVPREILIVAEIPKSPTGKLRRAGLAEAFGLASRESGRPGEDVAESPRSGTMNAVGRLWSELLNVGPLGPESNFFRVGGDSILASRFLVRVRKQFGIELPLRTVFETPRLAELSAIIDREMSRPRAERPAVPGPENAAGAAPAEIPSAAADAPVPRRRARTPEEKTKTPLAFSLFFFSADGSTDSRDKYRLVLEASQFADRHGYSAVWTPERHFHAFGGLYPNPAVLGAAIAAVTSRIQIRAASVVLPLQNPIRVAEEWSLVDNISGGRAGISFASGWHVNDFALWPSHYEDRRAVMLDAIQTVRDLWEGRPVMVPNGVGNPIAVKTFPRPIQRRLPVWLSCHSDAMFRKAGELGFGVITSMFVVTVEELAHKVAIYREARAAAGHDPATGHVGVNLHTYLGESEAAVQEKVGGAYLDYLLVNLGLQAARIRGSGEDFDLPAADKEFLTRQASERLFSERGLVGTVASCREKVAALAATGVDEIACLIDFGIDFDSVMAGLYQLNRLKELAGRPVEAVAGP